MPPHERRHVVDYGPIPVYGDLGIHEGDWENVRVHVDLDRGVIASVEFTQHGDRGEWLRRATTGAPDRGAYQIRDGRPVVYSAWHSHASHPSTGYQRRLKPPGFDQTGDGQLWNGAAQVIAIARELLVPGETFTIPDWVRWQGRWGSTVAHAPGLPNSPDGPLGKDWLPPADGGIWGKWTGLTHIDRPLREVDVGLADDWALHAVMLDVDGRAWSTHQRDGHTDWTRPAALGGQGLGGLVVTGNATGTLTAAALHGTQITLNEQLRNSDGDLVWSGWQAPPYAHPQPVSAIAVGVDKEVRLHASAASFAVRTWSGSRGPSNAPSNSNSRASTNKS